MANYSLFIGWNRINPGREADAGELFESSMGYYGKLQQEGTIENFEPVILSRHGGDLNGFIILRGERTKLNELKEDKDFILLTMKCDNILTGFGVVDGYIGETLQGRMSLWRSSIA